MSKSTGPDVFFGISKLAEGASAVTRIFSAFAPKGSAAKKGWQVAASLCNGVANSARIQALEVPQKGAVAGQVMNGLATLGEIGAISLVEASTGQKVAGTVRTLGSLGTDLFVMEQARRLAEQSKRELPAPQVHQLEPQTIDVPPESEEKSAEAPVSEVKKPAYRYKEVKKRTPALRKDAILPLARIASGVADLGAVWCEPEGVPSKLCRTVSAGVGGYTRHQINQDLAEAGLERAVGTGSNVVKTAAALTGVYAPGMGKVVDISDAVAAGVLGYQQTKQLERTKKKAAKRRRELLSAGDSRPSGETPAVQPASARTLDVPPCQTNDPDEGGSK